MTEPFRQRQLDRAAIGAATGAAYRNGTDVEFGDVEAFAALDAFRAKFF